MRCMLPKWKRMFGVSSGIGTRINLRAGRLATIARRSLASPWYSVTTRLVKLGLPWTADFQSGTSKCPITSFVRCFRHTFPCEATIAILGGLALRYGSHVLKKQKLDGLLTTIKVYISLSSLVTDSTAIPIENNVFRLT
jgi:hypothetical protein